MADAYEAAAVFFNGAGQVKAFGHKLVAQAGAVVVGLDVRHADTTVKATWAKDGDAVVKNFDLDVARVCIAAVHHGVEQCLAQRGQRVSKAFFALNAAIKFKCHADVRDDKGHAFFDHLEQGVGQLPVIKDHAWRFEAAYVDVVAQGFAGKQQQCGPGGLACGGHVVEFLQGCQWCAGLQGKPPACIHLLNKAFDFAG